MVCQGRSAKAVLLIGDEGSTPLPSAQQLIFKQALMKPGRWHHLTAVFGRIEEAHSHVRDLTIVRRCTIVVSSVARAPTITLAVAGSTPVPPSGGNPQTLRERFTLA